MNIKFLFAVAIGLVIIMIGLVAWLFLGQQSSSTTVGEESPVVPVFPVGEFPPSAFYNEEELMVPTTREPIGVRNFVTDADVVADRQNPGLFLIGDSTPTAPYTLSYIAQTGYFGVTLMRPPFATARDEAARNLKERLGITDAELCELRYTVAVPAYVNEGLSGTDYGFAQCPDGLMIPE
jgi:hypothetical protein